MREDCFLCCLIHVPVHVLRYVRDRFIDSLKLFKIGYSWGGANSLAVPYRMTAMRKQWSHQGQLVRLNIGLEDTRDLIADLEQALATLA